jgi:hypothetical protein
VNTNDLLADPASWAEDRQPHDLYNLRREGHPVGDTTVRVYAVALASPTTRRATARPRAC